MWSQGAVVVIERGDTAISHVLKKSLNVEESQNLERDCKIALVSHKRRIANAMEDSRKYARPAKPTPKPLLYLQIGYAMIACGVDAVLEWIVTPPKWYRKQRRVSRKKHGY